MDRLVVFIRLIILTYCALSLFGCHKSKHRFSGYTDTLYVYLSAPSMGLVDEKLVERGQVVKQGDILFRLSAAPDDYSRQAALDTYFQSKHTVRDLKLPRRMPEIMAIENQILQTQAAMRRVELHLNRLLKLQKKQFIDPDTIDNQTQTLKELSFQEKQFQENLILAKMGARPEQIKAQKYSMLAAKQQFEQADWYVKHKTLVAPGDGYVFDTFYSVGELVAAQKPICVMVIPQNNYLEFFVNSHDLSQLRLGQELSYQLYGEKTQHQANISYIAASAEYMPPILYTPDYQEELVFRVRAKPQDASHFLLGQPVDVWI